MKNFLSSKKMIKVLIIMILFLIIIAIGFFIFSIFHDSSDNDLQQVQNIYEEIFKSEETQNENIILTAVIKQEENNNQDNNENTEKIKPSIPTTYNGFETIGKIEIPKTNLDTFLLSQVTIDGMEVAPCFLYTTGELNKSGNTLIVGHNYQNNTLFSNNKYLEVGDIIKITSLDGEEVEYEIYDKFITTPEDVSYLKKDIGDNIEISLSCCTDNDDNRIVILARAKK